MERAVRIYRYGPPEALTIEPIETPTPGPGQALIRHTAIGLNFVEVYFRRGTFEVPALPAVLGNEGAGVVEAVGPGVNDVSIGDRVVYADGHSAPMPRRASIRRIVSSASPMVSATRRPQPPFYAASPRACC
jgi:NADPH:quinone reductase-like Zn-dependent oxidoreductase